MLEKATYKVGSLGGRDSGVFLGKAHSSCRVVDLLWKRSCIGVFRVQSSVPGECSIARVVDVIRENRQDKSASDLPSVTMVLPTSHGYQAAEDAASDKPILHYEFADGLNRYALNRPDFNDKAITAGAPFDTIRNAIVEAARILQDHRESEIGAAFVHGHLTPENIRVVPDGAGLVLVDGGCFRLRHLSSTHKAMIEREAYLDWLPPEIRHAESRDARYDEGTDSWGLANLLLRSLRPDSRLPSVVPAERSFWNACLSEDPADRPALSAFARYLKDARTLPCGNCGRAFPSFLLFCPACPKPARVSVRGGSSRRPVLEPGGDIDLRTKDLEFELSVVAESSDADAAASSLASRETRLLARLPAEPRGMVEIAIRLVDRPTINLTRAIVLLSHGVRTEMVGRSKMLIDGAELIDRIRLAPMGRGDDVEALQGRFVGQGHRASPDGARLMELVWTSVSARPLWLLDFADLLPCSINCSLTVACLSHGGPVAFEQQAEVIFAQEPRLDPLPRARGGSPNADIDCPVVKETRQNLEVHLRNAGDGMVEIDDRISVRSLSQTPRLALPDVSIVDNRATSSPYKVAKLLISVDGAGAQADFETFEIAIPYTWEILVEGRESIRGTDTRHLLLEVRIVEGTSPAAVVAIDFGATNSCIVAADPSADAGGDHMIGLPYPRNPDLRDGQVPEFRSLIVYAGTGSGAKERASIGLPALSAYLAGDSNAFPSMKPFLGRRGTVCPIWGCDERGVRYCEQKTPVEVVADFYIASLRTISRGDELGGAPRWLILTHPVRMGILEKRDFGDVRRRIEADLVQRQTARVAIEEIDEATAVAIYYIFRHMAHALTPSAPVLILILDVGGCTTDLASVLVTSEASGPASCRHAVSVLDRTGCNFGGNHANYHLSRNLMDLMTMGSPSRASYPVMDINGVEMAIRDLRATSRLAGEHGRTDRTAQWSAVDYEIAETNARVLDVYCDEIKRALVGETKPGAFDQLAQIDSTRLPFRIRPVVAQAMRAGDLTFDDFLRVQEKVTLELLQKPIESDIRRIVETLRAFALHAARNVGTKPHLVLSGHSAHLPLFAETIKADPDLRAFDFHLLSHAEAKVCVAQGAFIYGQTRALDGLMEGDEWEIAPSDAELSLDIGCALQQALHRRFEPMLRAGARLLDDQRIEHASLEELGRLAADGYAINIGSRVRSPSDLELWEQLAPGGTDLRTCRRIGRIAFPSDSVGRGGEFALWANRSGVIRLRVGESICSLTNAEIRI